MSVTRLPVRRYFSAPRLERRRAEFVLLIALAVLLELAAGVGLAYVAGFSRVLGRARLRVGVARRPGFPAHPADHG